MDLLDWILGSLSRGVAALTAALALRRTILILAFAPLILAILRFTHVTPFEPLGMACPFFAALRIELRKDLATSPLEVRA